MPGPTIPWKLLDTGSWKSSIDSIARYRLASPKTITGAPSFAMGAVGQLCVIRVYIGAGTDPDLSITVSGTALVALTNAVGGILTAQELVDLWVEVQTFTAGATLLTTDEPNGSPSAPFASIAARNAAAPFPAGSKPEVVGSPVNTVYQLKSTATQAGAIDADWQVFGAGGGVGVVIGTSYPALPAGTADGQLAWLPKLLGNGGFYLQWVSATSRWAVLGGQSIISDIGPSGAGYSLIAASTATVVMASVIAPAGLIGDGEQWEGAVHGKTISRSAGTDIPLVRIGGAYFTSNGGNSVVGSGCHNRGEFTRIGGVVLIRLTGTVSDLYQNNPNETTLDLSVSQTLDVAWAPGVAGNSLKIQQWSVRRIG